jgi:multidrug efflux pump
VQADAPHRMEPDDLMRLNVINNQGKPVPLSAIGTTRWITGPIQTVRFNGYPAMRISGDAAPGYSTGDAMDEMERLAGQLPAGFAYEWTGQSREERLSGSTAILLLGFSLLAVFLCLSALYESWSIPFAVLLAVPLGVLGAVLGATLRGMPNDVFFKVGLITVIGLSAKNAILIIEFAKDLHAQGMDLIEATLQAVHLRFRPILMTSIAFILGVLPLVVSTGAGSASQRAIGTGVMGGMFTATFLAIFFIPVFFVVVRRRFRGGGVRGPKPAHDVPGMPAGPGEESGIA